MVFFSTNRIIIIVYIKLSACDEYLMNGLIVITKRTLKFS